MTVVKFKRDTEDELEDLFVGLITEDIRYLEADGWSITSVIVSPSLWSLIGFHIELAENTSDYNSLNLEGRPSVKSDGYKLIKESTLGDRPAYRFLVRKESFTEIRVLG